MFWGRERWQPRSSGGLVVLIIQNNPRLRIRQRMTWENLPCIRNTSNQIVLNAAIKNLTLIKVWRDIGLQRCQQHAKHTQDVGCKLRPVKLDRKPSVSGRFPTCNHCFVLRLSTNAPTQFSLVGLLLFEYIFPSPRNVSCSLRYTWGVHRYVLHCARGAARNLLLDEFVIEPQGGEVSIVPHLPTGPGCYGQVSLDSWQDTQTGATLCHHLTSQDGGQQGPFPATPGYKDSIRSCVPWSQEQEFKD